MQEPINEQINVSTDTAGAEVINSGEDTGISLGKFKDVNALLNAYNSLQAEFTKRCQRLKELEGTVATGKGKAPLETVGDITESANLDIIKENNIGDKDDILKDYLKGVLVNKQKAIVMSEAGTSVKAPVKKPKTIAEAGLLARELL